MKLRSNLLPEQMSEPTTALRIALAAARQEDHDLVAALLSQRPRSSTRLEVVPDLDGLLAAAGRGACDACLVDAALLPDPPDQAMAALVMTGLPIVLLVEDESPDADERWIALGAWDCLVRFSLTPPVLSRSIRRGVEHAALLSGERQRRHAAKMDALARMAGSIAHDFNNLLTAILGYAEMLRESLPADDPGRQDAIEIQRAGSRATALTRQLLAFSGRNQPRPSASEIDEAFLRAEARLRPLLGDAVSFSVVHERPLHPVRIDTARVEQVLAHLATNARDAMPGGGTFRIEATNVELTEQERVRIPNALPCSYVRIVATDSGTGMAPEAMAHLFEPFFTTKPKGHGTGLGLPVVYGLARQARGHVEVESRPGEGTTVRIYLPGSE
jgi:signal transduction histidine kinase